MTTPAHLYQQPWPQGGYRLFQIGFVVDDVVDAARGWVRSFGAGPFHVLPRNSVPCTYRGAPSTMDTRVAVTQLGPVQIELIQVYGNHPSVFADVFGPNGTGFHQLCTLTTDFDATRAHHVSLGHDPVCEVSARGLRVSFFDTFAEFGFYTEVVEHSDAFVAQLSAISDTCASWDGTDPVRLMRRDGYDTPE